MNNSVNGSGAKKTARQQILEWVYKFSDDLANLFGGLFVFSIGLIAFVFVINTFDLYSNWKIDDPLNFTILIALALIFAILSLKAMFHFARQLDQSNRGAEENAVYRLNDYSLETLRTIGIGKDVVKALKAQLEKSGGEIDMTLSPETPDSWLDNLKKDLGEARVEECQAIILKYTRRPKAKIDDHAAPDKAQQPVLPF